MSEVTFKFQIPEERDELDTYLKAEDFRSSLWDISQEVFRPARKHGYSDPRLQLLIEKLDEQVAQLSSSGALVGWPMEHDIPMNATDLISLLEQKFYRILEEHEVSL